MRRIDFRVAERMPTVQQGLDQLAATNRRKSPVRAEADQQELGARLDERCAQVTGVGFRWIEVIQCTGDEQIGVGVKVLTELVALVAQVAFDLEFDIKVVASLPGQRMDALAAELFLRARRRPRAGTTPC
jgi:hypothetical protein